MSDQLHGRGHGGEADADEARALESLGDELRSAHPDPELPPGFASALRARWAASWTWRHAIERSPLLRAAAVLLMVSATAVPVAALVVLLQAPDRQPLRVEILPAEPTVVDRRARPDLGPVAPAEPDPEALLVEGTVRDAWHAAAQRDNRMAWAAQSWNERFPVRFPDPAGLPSELQLAEGARLGLELRLGVRSPGPAPLLDDWSAAGAELLWAELERRHARREAADPPPALVQRVNELWETAGPRQAEMRGWLQGWRTILDGSVAGTGYRLPAPGGSRARVFWEAVSWQLSFPDGMRSPR